MSRILIIKSLEDALRTYDEQSTVTPQNYYEVLGRLTHLSNAQRQPDVTRRLPMIPVKKPSQINLEQAQEDHLEDQIDEWHEGQDTLTRQRREMMEVERQIRDRHINEDYLNWLQNPNTTLKAEAPPIFNPETHEDLTALRWLPPQHMKTWWEAQNLKNAGRGSTGEYEDQVDSVGEQTLPGYKEGYYDQITGTWVTPSSINALHKPDFSSGKLTDQMKLLGLTGEEGIPNFHRESLVTKIPEGFQYGGYDPSRFVEVKLPQSVRSPQDMSNLIEQAELAKKPDERREGATERAALRRVQDWGGPKAIPLTSTAWDKKTPATFQELLEAGHFKVASEDEAKIDALSILKEIVDINHNEELEDNFKDDIMTLDRNHTMTRNQNGTMIENITPEMKNVIELMASNYNNNEPEPKGKEKSPFFV